MNAILVTLGSFGDVHPFVGLGIALQARGHRVTLVANAHFEALARKAGLHFIASDTVEHYQELVANPDLWHPLLGFQTVVQGLASVQKRIHDILVDLYQPGKAFVASSTMAWGARVAQETHKIPLATIHLSPCIFRSKHQAPHLPPLLLGDLVPKPLKEFQYWLADYLLVDRIMGRYINELRAEFGLRPEKRILSKWIHSPCLTVGMFPEWFAPPQPDWPEQTHLSGFPLYDESNESLFPESLEQFLDGGTAPIVFTPGSAMIHGESFFRTAVETCRLMGRRGLLLTRYSKQIPKQLPSTVLHESFVPLGKVLPRSAAIVHHGGIGTTSQALAAGIPQLIMPMTHDQPDNAARIVRLRLGGEIQPREFHPKKVAATLGALIQSEEITNKCRVASQRTHDNRSSLEQLAIKLEFRMSQS